MSDDFDWTNAKVEAFERYSFSAHDWRGVFGGIEDKTKREMWIGRLPKEEPPITPYYEAITGEQKKET